MDNGNPINNPITIILIYIFECKLPWSTEVRYNITPNNINPNALESASITKNDPIALPIFSDSANQYVLNPNPSEKYSFASGKRFP